MYSQQKTPSHEPGPEESGSEARGPLWRVWGDLRRGAERLPRVGAALPPGRAARIVHGVSLPWHVLRALLAEPRTRRRYLTVSLGQAGTILALALLVTSGGAGLMDGMGDQVEQQVDAAEVREESSEEEGAPTRGRHPKVRVELDGEGGVTRVVVGAMRGGKGGAESRKGWGRWLVYGAALLSSLQLIQWVVIALTRDFHTELSREASLLMGVPVEDEPLVPRVRLNLGWMRNKLKRRWRGLWMFSLGLPLLWLCKHLVPGGQVISPVLLSLWGAWWFVVFTAGKSPLAWREPTPREPWFLRGWKALTSWFGPLRVYVSLWKQATGDVVSPIDRVERAPWGFTGLALVRALSALPLVKCFLRPLIPVAATHLLLAEERGASGREGD